MAHDLNEVDLRHFTGSETIYRHGLMRSVCYTEGVQYLAEHGGAYWLVDKVATLQMLPKIRGEGFQVWRLVRDTEKVGFDTRIKGNGADLIVDDGNGNVVHQERIDPTDFPLAEAKLYFVDNILMLPSEY